MAIEAGILAGGQARRMGGLDKGLQIFQGQTMASKLADLLLPYCDRLLISANRNESEYSLLSDQVFADEIGSNAGPLAGIYTLLTHGQSDYLLLCPCDTPLLDKNYPSRMLAALDQLVRQDLPVAVACVNDHLQPLHMLIARTALSSILQTIESDQLSVKQWLVKQSYLEVDFSDLAETFTNINSPEQLR